MERLTLEVYEGFARCEVAQSDAECHKLRYDGCRSRTTNTPTKLEDEDWVENYGYEECCQGDIHRLARVSRRAYHIIHSEVEVGDDISEKDNLHKLSGISQSLLRGTTTAEQEQNLIEEGEHKCHYRESDNDIEKYGICKGLFGSRLVALAKTERYAGTCTYTYHSTECRTDIHNRHRDGHTCYRCTSDTVTHKGTVDDMVERRRGHCYNRRYGVGE